MEKQTPNQAGNTHQKSMEILEEQIRQCFGKIVWTHTTQEKCANILNSRAATIKLWQIILSAVTTTGIIVSLVGDNKWGAGFSAVISFILVGINAYVKDVDMASMAHKHAECAVSLWNLREKYLSLLTDIRSGLIGAKEIKEKRDKLQSEVYSVYENAPRSFGKAYKEASKGLKKEEEQTLTSQEINSFLPDNLKKS